MLRFVIRRCGLLNTVLWSLLLVNLAVLALILGPVRAFSAEDPSRGAARIRPATDGPQSARAAATADEHGKKGRPRPGADKGGPAAPAMPEGPRPGDAPLLCGPQEALLYSSRGRVAVAADRAGHFTLYGDADPDSRRPTDRSYDLLRDCSPELSFANTATVVVDGNRPELAGAENNSVRTRKAPDGAMTTVYRFAGGIELTQTLRLAERRGNRGPVLEISYRLANRSKGERTVGLRSLLNPPIWAAAPDRPAYRAPVIAKRPVSEGGRKNGRIVSERTMLGEDAYAPFYVPRRGAASDSSGRWEPGEKGPPPDRITFAGSLQFLGAPFFYEARLGYALPPNTAFAVYWTGLRIKPAQELTVSHRYVAGPVPTPPPDERVPSASPQHEGGTRRAH